MSPQGLPRAPLRALVYVQHLLGIGHLARITRVVAALRDQGVAVTLVKGGMPVAGFDVTGAETVQLDPVRADPGAMDTLVDAHGQPFGAERQAARRDALLATLRRTRPDIILVEAFPFGRRAMRFELLPLLEEARAGGAGLIACSIRDILQQSTKQGRAEATVELVERWFDLVLVHGDEHATPLSASFPLADRIAPRVAHTGLVGPPPGLVPIAEHAVIVSAGGGAVGAALIEAALAARPLTPWRAAPWLVLAGPAMAAVERRALDRLAGPGVEIRSFVDDLPARLAGASLSISQAGYNTVAEVMAAGVRAVLVPFEQGGETEQVTRAAGLVASGRAVVVREGDLGPAALAEAARRVGDMPVPARTAFDGAARAARLLLSRLAEKARGDARGPVA